MACVTACYDPTPTIPRPPTSCPATRPNAPRATGPVATARRTNTSPEHSTAAIMAALFDQAEQRDHARQRRWIVLVDGANHQLDCIEGEADKRGVKVDVVIDFIHVLEYLWKAADDLDSTRPARAAFVQTMARDLLEGHAPRVIADLHAHQRPRHADARPAPPPDWTPPPTSKPSSPTSTTTSPSRWAGRSPPA